MASSRFQFTKMHGLGNDYVYVDMRNERMADPVATARVVSDRHRGIGSDGLILIHPSDSADARMEMYNADGSRAQMCGNGIRCVAKFAVENGFAGGPTLWIDTDDGVKQAEVVSAGAGPTRVRIDMGKPQLAASSLPCTISGERVVDHPLMLRVDNGDSLEVRMTGVSMGNPHATVFVDNVEMFDLHRWGPLLENAPEFPERVNAHFVEVISRAHVRVRTWERGSGPTKACGTGACAVVVAGALTERCDRRATTTLPGGDLEIDWSDDDHVYMTGPAEEVFRGTWGG